MRRLLLAAALSAAVLCAAQDAGAISPCCAAANGEACNQDPADQPPDGAGCQEQDDNTCIGGTAGADLVQGCVCVAGVCASGSVPPKPAGPGKIGVEMTGGVSGNTNVCTQNAVAGCKAAGETHPAE